MVSTNLQPNQRAATADESFSERLLLPPKMLDVIGKKASVSDIFKLVANPDFVERLQNFEPEAS